MLFVFDWDGTLLDSTAKIIRCMQAAFVQQGLPVCAAEQVREIIGLALPEAIAQIAPELSAQQVGAVRQAYSEHFLQADKQPCAFFPGVEQTLARLREDGHQLAVATGKSRRGLDRVLANLQLGDFFDATRCADETRSKPDPAMLFALMEELAVAPERVVMIGDTEFDMAMACNAGVARVAVSYGAHPPERLRRYAPLACIDSMAQLPGCADWPL